jgi:hypothetical protein
MAHKDAIEVAKKYWESILATKQAELADLVHDQAESLETTGQAVLDYSPYIIKTSLKIDEVSTVLTQLKTLKNGK